MILLAIFFGLVDGCPLPPRESTPAWEKGFVEPIRDAQRVVLRPVVWIRYGLRVAQRWAVYQAPSRDAYRLWVEGGDARGRWHVLFRAGDSEHTAYASLIDTSRPRGAWSPTDVVPPQYEPFARWLTERVLDDHPEYVAARVRLEKVELTADGVISTGRFVQPYMRLREGAR